MEFEINSEHANTQSEFYRFELEERDFKVTYKGKEVTNVYKLILNGSTIKTTDEPNNWRAIIDGEERYD